MIDFSSRDIKGDKMYLSLLSAICKLSGLFSDSSIPFINYRVAENIFCKSFSAENLSRSDTAFDAKINNLGIGLKTFICPRGHKIEKIAEFNALSNELRQLSEKALAIRVANYRNDRINLAKRLYGIDESIYHIVARQEKKLVLFETDYDVIDINAICDVKTTQSALTFSDNKNFYSFNFSKSTLYRKFFITDNARYFDVEIIEDPYALLLDIFSQNEFLTEKDAEMAGVDYVVLPLYSTRIGKYYGDVPQRSGLNQWNAGGRTRDLGEVYIPVPRAIHSLCPNFFPSRDSFFELRVPTGEIFNASLCQEASKALMTNPNKALSDWLLRDIFQLNKGELLTKSHMDILGFDSVIIYKKSPSRYHIDIMKTGSYEKFIQLMS